MVLKLPFSPRNRPHPRAFAGTLLQFRGESYRVKNALMK